VTTRLTVLACLLSVAAFARASQAPVRDVPDLPLSGYLQELDRIRGLVDALDERRPAAAGDVLSHMPPAWRVVVDGQRFEASAEWIRRSLVEWRTAPSPSARHQIAERLKAVREEAARYAGSAPDTSAERGRLHAILAAREFRDLKGPSWFDVLRQRAMTWLINALSRVLGASAIPAITNAVVYVAIAIVVVLVAGFLYRSDCVSRSQWRLAAGSIAHAARVPSCPRHDA
jgi:hypothetical protein